MTLNGYSWVQGNVPNMVDPSGKRGLRLELNDGGAYFRQLRAAYNAFRIPNPFVIKGFNSGFCGSGDTLGTAARRSSSMTQANIHRGISSAWANFGSNGGFEPFYDQPPNVQCDWLDPSDPAYEDCITGIQGISADSICTSECRRWHGVGVNKRCKTDCLNRVALNRMESLDDDRIELFTFDSRRAPLQHHAFLVH